MQIGVMISRRSSLARRLDPTLCGTQNCLVTLLGGTNPSLTWNPPGLHFDLGLLRVSTLRPVAATASPRFGPIRLSHRCTREPLVSRVGYDWEGFSGWHGTGFSVDRPPGLPARGRL